MAFIRRNLGILSLWLICLTAQAEEIEGIIIPLEYDRGVFYTEVDINGIPGRYLVDTGAGRTIISHDVFQALSELGDLHIIGKIKANQADGSALMGTRYVVKFMKIGRCEIDDIVIAYFDSIDQNILGMSALDIVSPFIFDTANDRLILTNCDRISNISPTTP